MALEIIAIPEDADPDAARVLRQRNAWAYERNRKAAEQRRARGKWRKMMAGAAKTTPIKCDHEQLKEVNYPATEHRGAAIDPMTQIRCAFAPCDRLLEVA